jgi:RNA polymerase sigma-70 factor (ECF subfamily)
MAVHRLRRRYREIFRELITETVANPADVQEELQYLLAVLNR